MIEPRNIHFTKNKRRRNSAFSRFIFYFILTVFLGVIVYILLFSQFLTITSIEINGSKYVEKATITKLIRPQISGKIIGIIDKNNLFLARRGKMEKAILDQFRIIRNVEVKKNFPSSLIINISERIPTVAICENQCFILDENGEAYDISKPLSDEERKYDLIRLISESGRDIKLGDVILKRGYMNYLLSVKKKLIQDLGFAIENGFRTPIIISNDIRIRVAEGWNIYFNYDIEIERSIEILKVVINEKIGENQRADLEYIDLRIDNKVFYKFKDGTASEDARIATQEASQVPVKDAPDTDSADKKNKQKKD